MEQFKVQVNPFTREVIIETNINDVEYTYDMYLNDDLDFWESFEVYDKTYIMHSIYDKEFFVSIYPLVNENWDYENECKVDLTIKLNDK